MNNLENNHNFTAPVSNTTVSDSFSNINMSAIFLISIPFIVFFTIIFYYVRKYGHGRFNRIRHDEQTDPRETIAEVEACKETQVTVLTATDLEYSQEDPLSHLEQNTEGHNVEHSSNSNSNEIFPTSSSPNVLTTFSAWMNQHLYQAVQHSMSTTASKQTMEPMEQNCVALEEKGPVSNNNFHFLKFMVS